MSLETKTVAELEEIAANLREHIRRNPNHAPFYEAELKDAEQWIGKRQGTSPPGREHLRRSRQISHSKKLAPL
jgi:hypothetical protein